MDAGVIRAYTDMTDDTAFQSISVAALTVIEASHAEPAPAGPTRCIDCGAVYADGQWRWGVAPEHGAEVRCPACERVAQGRPAAILVLKDGFFGAHRAEVAHLIDEAVERARALHPLQRLMAKRESADRTELAFTSLRLARELSETLHHAYRGQISYHHDIESGQVRIVLNG